MFTGGNQQLMQFLRDLVDQRCGGLSSFSPKNLQLPILSQNALDFLKLKSLLKHPPPFPQCPSSGALGFHCPRSLLLSVVFQCYSQGNVRAVDAGGGLVLAAIPAPLVQSQCQHVLGVVVGSHSQCFISSKNYRSFQFFAQAESKCCGCWGKGGTSAMRSEN